MIVTKLFSDSIDFHLQKILINFLLIAVFAFIYWTIDKYDNKAFYKVNEHDAFDFVYFSIITHTTLGPERLFLHNRLVKFFMMLHLIFMLSINIML